MIINNKKWKNINVTIIVFTIINFVFEIAPRLWDLGSQTINWVYNSNKLNKSTKVDSDLTQLSNANKN